LTDLENVTSAMQDLVELLRTERLRRGWTLQDVSTRTHLSITILKALEGGRFESIGGPVIIDGLLRAYSTVLEIDSKPPGQAGGPEDSDTRIDREPVPSGARAGAGKSAGIVFLACCGLAMVLLVLSLHGWKNVETGIQTQETHPGAVEDQAVKAAATDPVPRIDGDEQPETPRQLQLPAEVSEAGNENSSPSSVIIPANPNSPANPIASAQTTAEPAAEPTDANQRLEPQPDRIAMQTDPPATAESMARPVKPNHLLEIQSDQKTWVQVVVDEGNAESELLQPGETREWKPMERARVVIGNGGGVRMKWDGKPVEISAKIGRVVRLTLPAP
jgi:cytoskeleton protein RodZ